MMIIIYDIIYGIFCLIYLPYLIIRGKWHAGFKARFGNFPPVLIEKIGDRDVIWIHAVSVGEVLAINGLIKKLSEVFPEHKIVCSTVTPTGYQTACDKLGDMCIAVYAPLDFSWIVRKFIKAIKPKIYISTETEIWPNLYTMLHKHHVPIVQVNGRISDKAYKGYKRVKFILKRILACVDCFCMQSDLDAERIRELGANREKVMVTGNLKFENVLPVGNISKEEFGFNTSDKLLVAGSTHPGEEEILIDAYARLEMEFSGLRLIIVPRHIERTERILQVICSKGYKAIRYSDIGAQKLDPKAVVVVDKIGELQKFYQLANVVFVGKSLTVGGGQNMIEPAALGKPTIVGPMTQNFKDIVKIFTETGAIIQVSDTPELYFAIRELLIDSKRAGEVGDAARRTVEKHQGATSKNVEAISDLLVG